MFRKLVIAIAALTSISAYAQTIERPLVKVGDECRYDVFDNLRKDDQGNLEKVAERRIVVTAVDGDRINTSVAQKILVSRDTEDLEEGIVVLDQNLNVVDINGRKFEPAFPGRFYPLAAGAEKKDAKSSYQRQRRDGETDMKVDGKASNWQKLVVPAGSFDAITITWDGFYNTSVGSRRWGAKVYSEVTVSSVTWCQVNSVITWHRGGGGVWSDRTYKLTGFKN